MKDKNGLSGYFHINDLGEVISFDGKLDSENAERIKEQFLKNNNQSVVTEDKEDVSPSQSNTTRYMKDIWGFFFDFNFYTIDDLGFNKLMFNGLIEEGAMNALIKAVSNKNTAIKQECDKIGIPYSNVPIELYINSPGGSVSDGFRFIDYIENLNINLNTIVLGIAASMGFMIWLVGKKRYMTKHSDVLIHQIRSGVQGKRADILDYIKHMEDVHGKLLDYIVEKTEMSQDKVSNLLSKETWLTSKEMYDMGLTLIK